ncbi:ATP-binding protein [Pseudomonas capsici]|uniref:ATP-binding protein n=1 Tax=Pseudomonas capsici TaxID=2810614 RepID=UPI0021F23586|nr:ATP-binding protein [Pseudomonas capsici]MCV4290871.1 ATP-binding protein [Pseudomonas capsici]
MNKTTLKTRNATCAEHGIFESELQEQFSGDSIWSTCNRCHFDALHGHDPEARTKAQDERDAKLVNKALLASGIPLRFRLSTLDNYRTDFAAEQSGVLARCEQYAADFKTKWDAGASLMLLGSMGTGKTHLACAIMQQVLRTEGLGGATARYTTASEIIMSVKETFGRRERVESEVYADLHGPDLLVIDEIGVQHGSDFERQVLFEVINGRYCRLLPTILISNLNLAEVRNFIGDRVIDRLCDGGGEVILFRWPSVRGEV